MQRHHKECACRHCAPTLGAHLEFLEKIRSGYQMTVGGLQKPDSLLEGLASKK